MHAISYTHECRVVIARTTSSHTTTIDVIVVVIAVSILIVIVTNPSLLPLATASLIANDS